MLFLHKIYHRRDNLGSYQECSMELLTIYEDSPVTVINRLCIFQWCVDREVQPEAAYKLRIYILQKILDPFPYPASTKVQNFILGFCWTCSLLQATPEKELWTRIVKPYFTSLQEACMNKVLYLHIVTAKVKTKFFTLKRNK